MTSARPRTLCIAGPTASGKSAAAMAVAARWPCEIVSVDSAQVYRGMDIGTAKPTAAERAAVPHHLIDVIDPLESYSAARFAQEAHRLVDQIQARGRLPVLVGGTMLYFKALWNGLDEIPSADEATRTRVRTEIDAEAKALGWPAMHEQLRLVDPVTAARLAPGDSQRIQRALEVWRSIGRPLSSFHRQQAADTDGAPPDMLLVSMEPADRAWLHARIDDRFDSMMAEGLEAEVGRLRARGDLHAALPSMRCVGYRQLWEAMERDGEPLSPRSRSQAIREGQAATRQLAKRQLTWLRSMPFREVIACDGADASSQVVDLAAQRMLLP